MPHLLVGRTPASAAGPLAGHTDLDLFKTSTSRARAPGAGQGTRPTNLMGEGESMCIWIPSCPTKIVVNAPCIAAVGS
jgi:hypothetical protein